MKQLKRFHSLGIQPRKQVVNYFLTLHVGTTKPNIYGNRYSVLKGYVNETHVITLGSNYGDGDNLIREALGKLNLPCYDHALLEIGVHLTVNRYTAKYRTLKNYLNWCAM